MAHLSRHVRLIYLVAVFQLLGGPAVLCGVIGLARLASDRQLTLAEHAARAVQRTEGKAVADIVPARGEGIQIAVELPQSNQPAQTPLQDEWKPKLNGILHCFKRPVIGSCFRSTRIRGWDVVAIAGPALRPPLPPPRAA